MQSKYTTISFIEFFKCLNERSLLVKVSINSTSTQRYQHSSTLPVRVMTESLIVEIDQDLSYDAWFMWWTQKSEM